MDNASAPMNGFTVCGGLVISDEFDVNDVAFGTVTNPFDCTRKSKVGRDIDVSIVRSS